MELVSLEHIDALLEKLDKKKCPWCDGEHWSIRVIPEAKIDSTEDISGLRALPHFRMFKEDGSLRGTMTTGVQNAFPVVVVRCDDCGYIYLFDYFRLIELYKEKYNNDLEADDE
ncbi:hypothetical protein C2J41_17820 [Salmonella enterica]|nr:hypothetical protein [Salmonella enterica]